MRPTSSGSRLHSSIYQNETNKFSKQRLCVVSDNKSHRSEDFLMRQACVPHSLIFNCTIPAGTSDVTMNVDQCHGVIEEKAFEIGFHSLIQLRVYRLIAPFPPRSFLSLSPSLSMSDATFDCISTFSLILIRAQSIQSLSTLIEFPIQS